MVYGGCFVIDLWFVVVLDGFVMVWLLVVVTWCPTCDLVQCVGGLLVAGIVVAVALVVDMAIAVIC